MRSLGMQLIIHLPDERIRHRDKHDVEFACKIGPSHNRSLPLFSSYETGGL